MRKSIYDFFFSVLLKTRGAFKCPTIVFLAIPDEMHVYSFFAPPNVTWRESLPFLPRLLAGIANRRVFFATPAPEGEQPAQGREHTLLRAHSCGTGDVCMPDGCAQARRRIHLHKHGVQRRGSDAARVLAAYRLFGNISSRLPPSRMVCPISRSSAASRDATSGLRCQSSP